MIAARVDAEAVRQAVSLIDLLPPEAKARRVGRDAYRALCSFHDEKTPAMSVRLTRSGWRFHCFACGESGGSVDYYMRTRKVGFRDALLALAGDRIDLTVNTPTKRRVPPWLLVCDERGCTATREVEHEDLPFLGETLAPSWHVTAGRCLCWRCVREMRGLAT